MVYTVLTTMLNCFILKGTLMSRIEGVSKNLLHLGFLFNDFFEVGRISLVEIIK